MSAPYDTLTRAAMAYQLACTHAHRWASSVDVAVHAVPLHPQRAYRQSNVHRRHRDVYLASLVTRPPERSNTCRQEDQAQTKHWLMHDACMVVGYETILRLDTVFNIWDEQC